VSIGAARIQRVNSEVMTLGWIAIVVAILGGAAGPFQSATNAELNKQLSSPMWALATIYGSGMVLILVVLGVMRQTFPAAHAQTVPWWAWMGGLISLGATLAGLTMAQKLGSGLFTAASLTAGVIVSIAVDHFGLLGMKQHAASPARMLGCVLLIAGVWVVAKF
jgi:transporter family-2 protein